MKACVCGWTHRVLRALDCDVCAHEASRHPQMCVLRILVHRPCMNVRACVCVCVVTGVPMVLGLITCACAALGAMHMCVHGFMCGCGPGSGNVCTCTLGAPGTAHTQSVQICS